MDSDEKKGTFERSLAKDLILRRTFGPVVDTFSDELKSQLSLLDDDEIRVLVSIKAKLNSGLPAQLQSAVDAVGVIVW
jgi:hypothetical protein